MSDDQIYRIEVRFDFVGTEDEARARAAFVAATVDGDVTAIFDEQFEELT